MFAMTAIKGIGRRFSNIVLKKADVDLNKRAGECTDEEVNIVCYYLIYILMVIGVCTLCTSLPCTCKDDRRRYWECSVSYLFDVIVFTFAKENALQLPRDFSGPLLNAHACEGTTKIFYGEVLICILSILFL